MNSLTDKKDAKVPSFEVGRPQLDSGSVRDDATDIGHSEVFDESLSEPKKVVIDPVVRNLDFEIEKIRSASYHGHTKMSRRIADPYENLPKSPHSKVVAKQFNFPIEEKSKDDKPQVYTIEIEKENNDQDVPPKILKTKEHKSNRKKRGKHSHHRHEKNGKDPLSRLHDDKGDSDLSETPKANKKLPKPPKEKSDDSHKKSKERRDKNSHKESESPTKKSKSESRHRRDIPILNMSDIHNRKQNKVNKIVDKKDEVTTDTQPVKPRNKDDGKGNEPEMQTIPVIKVNKYFLIL